MKKILVLGAGRVGATIATDLAADFEVTAADRSEAALEKISSRGVSTAALDIAAPGAIEELVRRHDLVVGAVPGAMGFETLRRVIESGRHAVDISFFSDDPFPLDALARERGVSTLVDCGVAPGLSNLVLGHLAARMESVESFVCLVGGLPVRRNGVWEYRAPFSPADVIEEYTRPARLRRAGQDLILPALEELELVEVPGLGTLEAFVTDGLRTLLRTMDTPTLVEKTLRYPGHAAKVKALRDSGFFGMAPVDVGGARVRPLELSRKLLEAAWRFPKGEEEDLTAMRVEVVGREGGKAVRHVFDLLDRYDPSGPTSSMARTTGYTCTALVRWLARGGWDRPGLAPPEVVGRGEGCFDFVTEQLRERGVAFEHKVEVA